MRLRMSENGLNLLKQWEGAVKSDGLHVPYDDATGMRVRYGEGYKGYLTIGYGHLLTKDELTSELVEIGNVNVEYWQGLTEEQAIELFDQDLDWAESAVNRNVNVELNQNQFEALVSFVFNVGSGAFRKSTLLRKLNVGEYDEVPNQLRRWTRSGGRVMQGLINRREHEIEHWNTAPSRFNSWLNF